jgi:hypothetical protein
MDILVSALFELRCSKLFSIVIVAFAPATYLDWALQWVTLPQQGLVQVGGSSESYRNMISRFVGPALHLEIWSLTRVLPSSSYQEFLLFHFPTPIPHSWSSIKLVNLWICRNWWDNLEIKTRLGNPPFGCLKQNISCKNRRTYKKGKEKLLCTGIRGERRWEGQEHQGFSYF